MAVTIEEALNILNEKIKPLTSEVITIEESPGRISASDHIADFSLPRFDNSAMDGYAVKIEDQGKTVKSDKVIYAGDNKNYRLLAGEAIRIMTGAPVPEGCEAIVPIEDARTDEDRVRLPDTIREGAHIRRSGEDIEKGRTYIQKGESITAYHTALFASQGVTHIPVTRRVRVAVFGTGDELRPHYEHIEAHQLYNSNAPMFLVRAGELGCDTSYIAGSVDTIESLKSCISGALNADLIITSGGVSVGDKDFTKEAFAQLGMETFFSGVHIKPGKPTTIGRVGDTIVVNLPGNPLAAMVNYELFVTMVIQKLSGSSRLFHNVLATRIKSDYSIKPGKYSVILGKYDGYAFEPLAHMSPGMISPLPAADVMIITTPQLSRLSSGDSVKILPIRWNFFTKAPVEIFTGA